MHLWETHNDEQAGVDIPASQHGLNDDALLHSSPIYCYSNGADFTPEPASQRVDVDEVQTARGDGIAIHRTESNESDDSARNQVFMGGDPPTGSMGFANGRDIGEGWWMRGWATENSNGSLPSDHTSGDVSGSERRTPDVPVSETADESSERGFFDTGRARIDRRRRIPPRLPTRRLNAWSRWQRTLSKV